MDSRRDFLKKALLLSGAAGVSGMLPDSVQRAMAIDPRRGSSYLDAEHVVILMQENRSFDHCYGTLRGVRGYNDPRAIRLPGGHPVWMQTNDRGESYLPFRFDIRRTKATWMGSVPHSRSSQVDANNLGKYDRWLQAKRVRNPKLAEMPLTLGYYTREDIPFYYAMADAFTVCDQNFASAMTSTRPNRLYFWTGTIRPRQEPSATPVIRNGLVFGEATGEWKTFPERLQENGISWKFYQNDIDCGGGFTRDERAWLANFGCNPMEWFANYNVKFAPRYINSLKKQVDTLPREIADLQAKIAQGVSADARKKYQAAIDKKQEVLSQAQQELATYSQENFERLSDHQKSLYERAFTTNAGDPDFHSLTTLRYEDGGQQRELPVPKGDVLYQFRQDVESGNLPTVSWLAGAQNLSDHPSAPWYGSLYVSEILDILTRNPEVWKKTIFIVTFDENDGYFDHVLPYVAPDPLNPATGKCSPGIDTAVEQVRLEDELALGIPAREARGGPIGLGFRVPMIIASPWSRGGKVCSQIFDHTSTLQFLEGFLEKKFGKKIIETQISEWRRTITGDLTSVFKSFDGKPASQLPFLQKEPFIEKIYNAKFTRTVDDFRPLTPEEVRQLSEDPHASPLMPRQEPGVRPACALAYELYADLQLDATGKTVACRMKAGNEAFGAASLGAPFNIVFPVRFASGEGAFEFQGSRSYALRAGDELEDTWPLAAFEGGHYHIRVYGPNGFMREAMGTAADPGLQVRCRYDRGRNGSTPTGNIELSFSPVGAAKNHVVEIVDHAYGRKPLRHSLDQATGSLVLDLRKSHGWYDFSVRVEGAADYERRFAGHVETGQDSITDPFMGRVSV